MKHRLRAAVLGALALALAGAVVVYQTHLPRRLSADASAPAAAPAKAAAGESAAFAGTAAVVRAGAPPADATGGARSGRDAAPVVRAGAPRSLRGTDVDGALRIDADGDLIVGPDLLALFDYFLSATGEEAPSVIRARIVAAIRERASTSSAAAEQAIALLDRYLDYREATRALRVPAGAGDDPAARLAALQALRRERFGAEDAERLFGLEEREGEASIAAREVALDATLSPEARDARLEAIEASLPEGSRVAREEATRPLRQAREEQALREGGATDEALYAHRVAEVGVDAADRLAELDRSRAAWTRRVAAFRAERTAVAARARDDQERRAAEEAILARDFSPAERLRVKALLSLTGSGAGAGE